MKMNSNHSNSKFNQNTPQIFRKLTFSAVSCFICLFHPAVGRRFVSGHYWQYRQQIRKTKAGLVYSSV